MGGRNAGGRYPGGGEKTFQQSARFLFPPEGTGRRNSVSIPYYFWFPVVISVGIGFISLSIPPAADQFMALFGVGYGGLSFLLSVYHWTHAFVQVPAGLLLDRIGVARSLVLSTGVSLACSLAPFLAPDNLALAVTARLLLGVCTGMLFLVAITIIKTLTPPGAVSRIQGVQGAAVPLGTMLPYLVLPCLGAYAWAGSYLLCAAFCLVFAYGAYRLPPEAGSRPRTRPTVRQTWESVKTIATSREVWFLGCSHGVAFGTLLTVIGNWLPSILVDTRPESSIEDWAFITGALLLAGVAGRVFSGEAARKMPRGLLIHRVTLATAVAHGVFAFAGGPLPIIAMSFIAAILCGVTFAPIFTLTTDTAQPTYVATAVGFMNMVANLVNVSLILFLGLARDMTGSFSPGLYVSGALILVFCLFSRRLAATIGENRA